MSVTFDAVYPGSASVGNVNLHVAGCLNLFGFPTSSYIGTFTITTSVGTLSGSVAGLAILNVEGFPPSVVPITFEPTLTVNVGTGSFAGTTGALDFVTTVTAPAFVGTISVA